MKTHRKGGFIPPQRRAFAHRAGTRRHKSTNQPDQIVQCFLEFLMTVKLFHWKTYSYASHKETDELYIKLNEKFDSFVEMLLGRLGGRIHKPRFMLSVPNSEAEFRKCLDKFIGFIVELKGHVSDDLDNVRQDILGILRQFEYLLTFK